MKKIILSIVMIMSLVGPLPINAGCCSHGHHGTTSLTPPSPSWLNNNWQGIVFSMVVLGPLRNWWDETGANAIRYVLGQVQKRAIHYKNGHNHTSVKPCVQEESCSCSH